jgi:2-aminoethylphosphonate-pyruvate transaminase
MKRVMVDMSATLIHHGHVRLIQQAREYGEVIIGLTSDAEVIAKKGYRPELDFQHRKEVLEAFAGVHEVVETPWMVTEDVLDAHHIDLLVHGDDNPNPIPAERLLVLPRTEGVSSTDLRNRARRSLVSIANRKLMLTPGPAGLVTENLSGMRPVFGRGDAEYADIETRVIDWLKVLSGQDNVVCMQGSATLALELGIRSCVSGKVLLIDTGYYSSRLAGFFGKDVALTTVSPAELESVSGTYDWIVCCYTETSCAYRVDLQAVRASADSSGARVFLDATASIGLEPDHGLADVLGFSSCKGLCGLAGAAFLAYGPGVTPGAIPDHYYFNLETHRNHGVTGPYHALCSLVDLIDRHEALVDRVRASKQKALELWKDYIPSMENQPLLCTYLEAQVEALDNDVVLYTPRSQLPGSIICHLGEINSERLDYFNRIRMLPL